MAMKVTTVANQKGGVGKTTIEVHLVSLAAEQGKRVLVVDLDEGDLSQFYPPLEDGDDTTYVQSSMLFSDEYKGLYPRQVAANIWLIEADVPLLDVDDMDLSIVTRLKEALDHFSADFDLCMIDTPPNLQRRMIAALAASDARMPKLLSTIEAVREQYNPNLQFLGFLPNQINSRSTNEIDLLPSLQESYGDAMFPVHIVHRPCINSALASGNPVWWKAKSGSQRAAGREMKSACAAVLEKVWSI
jgi:chromosome partitioning protein